MVVHVSEDDDTGDGEDNGDEPCEQAVAELTVASHESMVSVRVAGSEDETASDVAEVLAKVLKHGREASDTTRRVGFE